MTEITPMLRKLLPMLASDNDAEVVAAVRAIGRVLRNAGADWHDLADVLLSDALAEAQTRRQL